MKIKRKHISVWDFGESRVENRYTLVTLKGMIYSATDRAENTGKCIADVDGGVGNYLYRAANEPNMIGVEVFDFAALPVNIQKYIFELLKINA